MNKINIDDLIEILPKLIRENDRVKGAIISALSGVVATHEDIVLLSEKMDKRFEAMERRMDKRFEAMDRKIDKKHDDLKSILEDIQSQIGKPFEQFTRKDTRM